MSRNEMKPYPLVDELLRPILRVARPRTDARDPCWTTQRAVGTAAFLARYLPRTATKNSPRACANSSPWRLKGVQYLFRRRA